MRTSREKLDAEKQETQRVIRQVNKQLGELGNKFGTFAEGMAFPSLEKILYQQFHSTHVFPRAKVRKEGKSLELDVLGYSNGIHNTAVIVEVKSHLRDEHIPEFLKTLEVFPDFFPEHKDKKLFAILVGVYAPESVRNLAKKRGIYIGLIQDDTFTLQVEEGFVGKDFNHD